MALLIGILLLVAIGFYLFFVLNDQTLENVQRKPLRTAYESGSADTEFAEDFSFESFVEEKELDDDFLPQRYDEDRLVLMVKDPEWLYAYWEISKNTKKHFLEKTNDQAWDESTPVLRIFNLNDDSHFDINIDDQADNWYIRINKPNCSFRGEIGRIYQGKYFGLISSNHISTPAFGFSEEIDPTWSPNREIWQSLEGSFNPAFGSNHLNRQEH